MNKSEAQSRTQQADLTEPPPILRRSHPHVPPNGPVWPHRKTRKTGVVVSFISPFIRFAIESRRPEYLGLEEQNEEWQEETK